ncbi:type III secretion apparatus protein SpaR/YscT/HrcT [Yersinia ruckeri]|uniref:type III secretion system export apparatus subunit SctT n=1 Tax=Yersinia ruckeri TaxID=29486 RepID=UPI0005ACB038|nr:type III secretion system export apparatus subunit SctT [Yersinia ruckeri]AJI96155.1 type III secretion apparatus protein SpaR/YscT/HrcT [Yersinia ruckeri]MCW6566893.1 type III secretion system export apparatus subunit SctT [Yersinia ruckeri]
MNKEMLNLYSSLYGTFNSGMITLALAYMRIAPVFFLLPFLNTKLLNGVVVKNSLIIYICLGLWPYLSRGEFVRQQLGIVDIILYELSIGVILAFFICMPFLIANIIGEIIDNQRGATISDTIDPANGIESSEFSALLNYIICMVFLSQGGMYKLVESFADSYKLMPFGQGFSLFEPLLLGSWLNTLVSQGFIMASPVLVTLFLSEVALGLYSRFCPQLNAFSLSLAVKSIIAFSVFLLYFQNEVPSLLVTMVDISPLGKIFTLK